MPKIRCHLVCHSLSPHLRQLYTGFLLLERAGLVELTWEFRPEWASRRAAAQYLRDATHAHLYAIVNGTIKVHYDTHDAVDIDDRDVSATDFYFKRSFSPAYAQRFGALGARVYPLGLNYRVHADSADWQSIRRAFALGRNTRDRVGALLDALDVRNAISFNPRLADLESPPDEELPARVLFLATAYDPYDRPDRSPAKIVERIENNEMRARCITLLRRELGPRFLGGFDHNAFTCRSYRKQLVADPAITRKRNYLRLLREHPVCIATTGLHGSTGWKMAEYVALSRAIVAEPLSYQVPGTFAPERNYLTFRTAEQCVQQCALLLKDGAARQRMMHENAGYYRTHLRPDVLVLNTVQQALATFGLLERRAVPAAASVASPPRAAAKQLEKIA